MRLYPSQSWLFGLALASFGCGGAIGDDGPTATGDGDAPVVVYAMAATPDTLLSGITLTVSGRGIPSALVYTLNPPSAAGQSVDTLDLPAGPGRILTARAFVGPIESHRGADTVDVSATGGTVRLQLAKLFGADTLWTSIEDFNLVVDDAASFTAATTTTTAAAGATVSLTAKLTYATAAADGSYAAGDPVAGAVVSWASDNPGRATVTSAACTTGAAGTCSTTAAVNAFAVPGQTVGLVANAKGIAQSVTLTVN